MRPLFLLLRSWHLDKTPYDKTFEMNQTSLEEPSPPKARNCRHPNRSKAFAMAGMTDPAK